MAGKSTVLRSVCAGTLLAMCGLHAPVARARVPFTDTLMLRNFSADSPLENKSSFAVEMVEMRYFSLFAKRSTPECAPASFKVVYALVLA
jgi:DNA mismatch repair ATPase MutS